MHKKLFVMMIFMLFGSNATFAALGEWEKIGDSDGVVTLRKEVPDSPVVAFRGEALIEDSMARIAGVLEAVEREKEWMADVVETYNIEKLSESDRWEYNRTKTPWPLQDRDFVIHSTVSFKAEPEPTLTIKMNSAENEKKPPLSGVVRGALIDSTFVLKFLEEKKTFFTCEIHADPKGAIPKWVVNLFQKSWPLDTISGLRRQLQKKDIGENETVKSLILKSSKAPIRPGS